MKRECETCIKRKTPYCPTSIDCMATDDMPYYQNRIMILEENQELNQKYLNAVADYEQEKFNVEEYKQEKQEWINLLEMFKNQQKAFIEYLENEINKIKEQIRTYHIWHEVGVDINFLILKKQFFVEILSKYKEIIGAENEIQKG